MNDKETISEIHLNNDCITPMKCGLFSDNISLKNADTEYSLRNS